jgi:hypothetical protein
VLDCKIIYILLIIENIMGIPELKNNQLIFYRAKSHCSEIQTQHINEICGHNMELFNVKHDGSYSDRLASKG